MNQEEQNLHERISRMLKRRKLDHIGVEVHGALSPEETGHLNNYPLVNLTIPMEGQTDCVNHIYIDMEHVKMFTSSPAPDWPIDVSLTRDELQAIRLAQEYLLEG